MKHIGLDVHSTTTHISIFSDRGRKIKNAVIPTRKADLVEFITSIPGPKQVALEESQLADFATWILTPYVTRVIRCLPQLINPITWDTGYLGGIGINMCTWSD